MTTTKSTRIKTKKIIPETLTPSTLCMPVLATTADAVYLRLPPELQRLTDGCGCEHCLRNPELAKWDTLVVPTRPYKRSMIYTEWHSYTCHMPDGAVAGFVARLGLPPKERS